MHLPHRQGEASDIYARRTPFPHSLLLSQRCSPWLHQSPPSYKNSINSTRLHPTLKTGFAIHFMDGSMWNVYGTSRVTTLHGLSTTWIGCVSVSLPDSMLRLAQALDILEPSGVASRKCLRELRSVCSDRGMLPTSYTIPSHLLDVHPQPFTFGGFGDVYHGTFDGSRVCIKRVRVYIRDGMDKALKVCYRLRCLPRPPSLTKVTGLLPRGRDVETHGTPKRRPPPGNHHL